MRIVITLCLTALGCLLVGAAEVQASDPGGNIYGRVMTVSGTEYVGFLRWGKQEAYWDDLFHSLKEDLPHAERYDDTMRRDSERDRHSRSGQVRVFKWRIKWEDNGVSARVFVARFGDISEIRVTGDEDAELLMRSGERYAVSGYSDDVGGTINVFDTSLGAIDLRWDRIETIAFEEAPSGAKPPADRLYGVIESEAGTFEGFVMWDKEECTSTDLLDGESEDGDMSIEMGRIAAIERRGRSSSIVELRDGRRLRLRGTNDVDDDNRGIMIQDERIGKVTIDWDAFDRLEFKSAPNSGVSFDDYPKTGQLNGTVTMNDGEKYRGRIVYDLDESESWEMLNGRQRDVQFDIPFANIASIEPMRRDGAIIVLRSGEILELEDSQDVSERNDGLLIWDEGDADPRHVDWVDIELIEFDH